MGKIGEFGGAAVAVYGAAGHTGRFVVSELISRGYRPLAVGRDIASLEAAGFPAGVALRMAAVQDAAELDRAFEGVAAVINCAGAFLDTADAVISSALRCGAHYLDVTAEQPSARATFETYDRPAREAGVTVIPAMGFFGGFADLLATVVLRDWAHADVIDVVIGLDSWLPTQGTRLTGQRNTAARLVIEGGKLVPVSAPAEERLWKFPDAVGERRIVQLPFSEVIVISRHLSSTSLRTYLSDNALQDVRSPSTPQPRAIDDKGRSAQRFVVEVAASLGAERRSVIAQGQDIYAFTAPLICEALGQLLRPGFSASGAHAPGAILNAQALLDALRFEHLDLQFIDSRSPELAVSGR